MFVFYMIDLTVFGIDGKEVDAVKDSVIPLSKLGTPSTNDTSSKEIENRESSEKEHPVSDTAERTSPSPLKKPMSLEEKWGFNNSDENNANQSPTNASPSRDNAKENTDDDQGGQPVLVSLLPAGNMKAKSKRPKFKAKMMKPKAKMLRGNARKK